MIFQHFLNLMGFRADEVVFIGDDLEADIKGAKEAGMKAVLIMKARNVSNHFKNIGHKPDAIVNSLSEFKEKVYLDLI